MRKLFPTHFTGKKGGILVEVLVSLVVFTLGVTGSLSLLLAAVKANSINRNRTIAINLAREGIEVVRNIRDTNWMIYSSHLRECWNYSPDVDENGAITSVDTKCVPNASGQNSHPLGMGFNGVGDLKKMRSFIVDFDDNTSRWVILPAGQYLKVKGCLDGTQDCFMIYSDDFPNGEAKSIGSIGGRNVNLELDASGRYTHAGSDPTPFLRVVDICYFDNVLEGEDCTNAGLYPTDIKGRDNRILVTSRVYWKDGANDTSYKSVIIETIITDYLDRLNWSD